MGNCTVSDYCVEGAGPKVVPSTEGDGFTFNEQWRNKHLTLTFSPISLVECQSHILENEMVHLKGFHPNKQTSPHTNILTQRMSPSLKTHVWRKRAENAVYIRNGLCRFDWLKYLREENSMN